MKDTKDPARYLLRWKAKNGVFEAYDRVEKESKILGDKVPFVVLEEFISVRGVTPDKKPIYSNEIQDLRLEELVVKVYGLEDGEKVEKTILQGFWDEIRPAKETDSPEVKRKKQKTEYGQKYCKVIYCAFWDGEVKFGKMELTGMAVGGWIEFTNSTPGRPKGVLCDGGKSVSTPNGNFFAPNFVSREVSEDTMNKAAEFKAELYEYVKGKDAPAPAKAPEPMDDDEVPF